jgi:hypothetical protein
MKKNVEVIRANPIVFRSMTTFNFIYPAEYGPIL